MSDRIGRWESYEERGWHCFRCRDEMRLDRRAIDLGGLCFDFVMLQIVICIYE